MELDPIGRAAQVDSNNYLVDCELVFTGDVATSIEIIATFRSTMIKRIRISKTHLPRIFLPGQRINSAAVLQYFMSPYRFSYVGRNV